MAALALAAALSVSPPASTPARPISSALTLDQFTALKKFLTPEELSELYRLADAWVPLPRQWEAAQSPAFEVLYGGAAGGAKSNLILWLARHQHFRSLLTRKSFPMLERSLIPDSMELYGRSGYNETKHRWTFKDKRRVDFGFLDNVEEYRGAAFDLFAPDELTELSEFQYLYLFSRVRSTQPGQRCRVVATTNPGGDGEAWVIARWAPWLDKRHPNPATPGELCWFKRDENGVDVETTPDDPDALSRTFIPARLADNPFLMADPNYRKRLMALPEPFRSQLLFGDWTAGQRDDAYQVIPTAWIEAAMARWKDREGTTSGQTAIGVDVARGGKDKTVIARRFGAWFAPLIRRHGTETPDGISVATLVVPLLPAGGSVAIDAFGIGSDAYGAITPHTQRIQGVLGNEPVEDETDRAGVLHFVNLRAAMYWRLRDALQPDGGDDIALPLDRELLADLTSVRFLPLRAHGIQLEGKDDTKKRLGRSPDSADAVALTFAAGYRSEVAAQVVHRDPRVARRVF
jgi:hypothetical protein